MLEMSDNVRTNILVMHNSYNISESHTHSNLGILSPVKGTADDNSLGIGIWDSVRT